MNVGYYVVLVFEIALCSIHGNVIGLIVQGVRLERAVVAQPVVMGIAMITMAMIVWR